MSGYHFKFAFSAEGNSASFAFEFSASNGCAFVNEENNLQLGKTKKYSLKSAEMTIKDNIIAWKADKESKFCDCIAFNIGENIGLEFAHLVLSSVVVDKRADHRVVYCVPDLNEKKKYRKKSCFKHHVNEPEGLDCVFEREAHVASEISRRVCEFIPYAEFALAFCVKILFFLHEEISLFVYYVIIV